MLPRPNIVLLALSVILINHSHAQLQCTASTTDCGQCDGNLATCETNENCRALEGTDRKPTSGPTYSVWCVNLGSCDSDCTVCADTAAACSDPSEFAGATGSRANCVIADTGSAAGTCVGASCGVACTECAIEADCVASEVEPLGCEWIDTDGDGIGDTCLPIGSLSSDGSSSSSASSSEDDTNNAMFVWMAQRMAANQDTHNEREPVWDSVYKAQTTQSEKEQDKAAAEEVEWSIGRVTMMNLWGMLLVCLCGNALICWITTMGKERSADFSRSERESSV